MSSAILADPFGSPKRRPRAVKTVALLGVAALLISYPFWASYYELTALRDALLLGLLALSLDFLWGKAGLPSFGHAAFFGLGGYVYAFVARHLDPAYGSLVAVCAATAIGVVLGLFLGAFLLRAGVRGPLFLIVTVAVTEIFQQIAVSWFSVTGGDGGLVGLPPLGLTIGSRHMALLDPMLQYFAVLALTVLLLVALELLCRGRYGRLLSAIVSDERRAQTLGVDVSAELTLALSISVGIAALAGAIYVAIAGVMVPDLIGPLLSIEVVVWVLVGGRGTLWGPVVGAFVVSRLSQEISSYDPRLWPLAIGAFFIGMVFLFPNGVASLMKDLPSALTRRRLGRAPPI